ncbi:hypothetical protein V7x_03800 [Crateriforma conspicua]|uniref:Uncharacterized protein n=1 Tax=Crateriforma conspicua TaxID=2527996 RepID=A0A5C6FRG4_9PLAN|nr:hypothetical protein V7x_03800 [Crateriforma conspicua]
MILNARGNGGTPATVQELDANHNDSRLAAEVAAIAGGLPVLFSCPPDPARSGGNMEVTCFFVYCVATPVSLRVRVLSVFGLVEGLCNDNVSWR